MSALTRALQKARAQVVNGWTKDKEVRYVFGRRAVCAIQALSDGAKGYRSMDYDLYEQERTTFIEAIKEIWPEAAWETIPDWNDVPERTKVEVLETFDRALKIAERDGL
jgi:hypothetical protein